jgi:hypothetical protein
MRSLEEAQFTGMVVVDAAFLMLWMGMVNVDIFLFAVVFCWTERWCRASLDRGIIESMCLANREGLKEALEVFVVQIGAIRR